jgi:hypothetical protein
MLVEPLKRADGDGGEYDKVEIFDQLQVCAGSVRDEGSNEERRASARKMSPEATPYVNHSTWERTARRRPGKARSAAASKYDVKVDLKDMQRAADTANIDDCL